MCTLLQAPALEWHAVPPGSTAASAGGEGEGRRPGGCRGAIPAADGRQRLGHGPPAPPSATVPGASQGRGAATSGSGRPGSVPGADSGRRKVQQCVGCRAAGPAGAPHHPPLTLLPPPAGAPSPPPLSPPPSLHGLLAGPFEWDRRAHGVSRRACKVWSGPLRCCPEADYRSTFLGFDARGLECRTRHKTSLTAQCMLTADCWWKVDASQCCCTGPRTPSTVSSVIYTSSHISPDLAICGQTGCLLHVHQLTPPVASMHYGFEGGTPRQSARKCH